MSKKLVKTVKKTTKANADAAALGVGASPLSESAPVPTSTRSNFFGKNWRAIPFALLLFSLFCIFALASMSSRQQTALTIAMHSVANFDVSRVIDELSTAAGGAEHAPEESHADTATAVNSTKGELDDAFDETVLSLSNAKNNTKKNATSAANAVFTDSSGTKATTADPNAPIIISEAEAVPRRRQQQPAQQQQASDKNKQKESTDLFASARGGGQGEEVGLSDVPRLSNGKRIDDDSFREDTLVREKWEAWKKAGKPSADAVFKGRTFFDPTPDISPTPNVSRYGYLKGLEGQMMPLYPTYLKDYRHTYGNCKGNFRYSTQYSHTVVHEDTENPDTFARLWPNIPDKRMKFATEHERCHGVMVRQLAILTSILEFYNQTNWFISHATLLGAVRHGGMIPWDVDVDVVMTRSTTRFLRKIWRKEFPRDMFLQSEKTDPSFHLWIGDDRGARIKDRYSGFHGFDFTHYNHKTRKKRRIARYQNGAGVDIIPINRVAVKGQPWVRDRMKIFHTYFNSSDVFPTRKICFENIEVRSPKDPELLLDLIYGEGKWRELPEHPILAAPTALPCVSTTPLWGSVWNLEWEKDHPMAANKSRMYPNYVPFISTPEEEARAANELVASEGRADKKRFQPLHPPPVEEGDVEIASPGGGGGGGGKGEENSAANNKNNKEKASKSTAQSDDRKPPTRYPLYGAKLFPRSDPHGTSRDDYGRPYMKYYPGGATKYGLVDNRDERA